MTLPSSDDAPGQPLPHRRHRTYPALDRAALSDDELMRAHISGDPDAFGDLVRRHEQMLWLAAWGPLKSHHDAKDAVQEALIRAFRFAHTWRGDAAVTAWLYRVVSRVAFDHAVARGKRSERESSIEAGGDNHIPVEDNATQAVAEAAVQEVVAELPADQADCFVRVHLFGFTYAETAVDLGLAEGTVKSRAARGKARLVRALRDAGLVGSIRARGEHEPSRGQRELAGEGRPHDEATLPTPRDDKPGADPAALPRRER